MSELSNVELNLKEIINIVAKNIALMFYRRNYMKIKTIKTMKIRVVYFFNILERSITMDYNIENMLLNS